METVLDSKNLAVFYSYGLYSVPQITFQVKRVKKAKADGTDVATGSDDNLNTELLTGGQSVLEISGPTIPSPGPSGVVRRHSSGL